MNNLFVNLGVSRGDGKAIDLQMEKAVGEGMEIGYGKGKYETSPFSGLRQRGMKIVDTGLAEEQGKSQEVERKSNVGELKTNCIVIVGLLLIVLVIWENKVRQIQ